MGGKLFFADGFKNRAFSVVREILSESENPSYICVVDNIKTAQQVKVALGSEDSEAKIIASLDEFRQICSENNIGVRGGAEQAKKFKSLCPRLIVTLERDGVNVLHSQLYQRSDKSSEYLDGTHDIYAFSDFLSDAAYDMLVVDNVYGMIAFEEADPNDNIVRTPRSHELIILNGKKYYTDVAHSYKKLSRLADSAAKKIVIASDIVDNNVISFYAAASLVYSELSYSESKSVAKKQSQNYDDEIDDLYNNMPYFTADSDLRSLCLQRARGRQRYIPGDLDRLSEYVSSYFEFMTKEEIFLSAMATARRTRAHVTNRAIINMIENDNDAFATTICDMFFSEKLKGDVEDRIICHAVAKMSDSDANNFFTLFGDYATYCATGTIGDRCKVYRIYHEDSGFEDLLRRSYHDFDRNENALSATHRGNDMEFKCAAVKKLLAEGKLSLPLIIVTNSNEDEVVTTLGKIVEYKPTRLPEEANIASFDDIFVTDYPGYESIANNLNILSVVFFDAMSDIARFDTYVKKALNMNENVNTALLVTYDNISGLLADLWQTTWTEENDSIVSIKNSKLYIRSEKPIDYNDVIRSISGVYDDFKAIIDKSEKVNIRASAENFCNAMTDFTLNRAAHASDIDDDFAYLNSIAPYYSAIFANSVSVGGTGREVFSEQLVPFEKKKKVKVKKVKEKKVKETKKNKVEKVKKVKQKPEKKKRKAKKIKVRYVYGKVTESKKIFFNVCSKQMHTFCDVRYKDCSTCELNQKIMTNDLEDFARGTKGYFKETEKILSKIQTARFKKQIDDTIMSTQSDSAQQLAALIDHTITISKETTKKLNSMLKKKVSFTAPFFAEYDDIVEIKDAVQSIHHMIFIKYFEQIMGILTKSTDEMKRSIATIGQAAKNSLSTSQIGGKHGIN
jgi:hypothetical protein